MIKGPKLIKKGNTILAKRITESVVLWMTGGLFYFYLEIAYRDYSHYSMIICGGLCFLIVGTIGDYILKNVKPAFKALVLIMFF